ncbi:MAG: tetratricopeptide repeat protein, partial [Planctomycetota bacterium]
LERRSLLVTQFDRRGYSHRFASKDYRTRGAQHNYRQFRRTTLGRAAEALPQFERALAMRKRLYGERDHPDVAVGLNSVASCLESLGRAAEALPRFEQALATSKRLYGDRDHSAAATSLNNVAFCLRSLGRAAEALPQFEQALAMRKRLYGDRDHPAVATSLNNVASCLASLGRAAEALPQFEQALAMQKRLHGNRDHPDMALGLNNVADCLRLLGRAAEALPQFEQALAMRKRLYGDRDHPDVATSLNNVAHCLRSLRRAAEALPQFEQALAMRRRLYGDRDHPDMAMSLNNVAACMHSLGRFREAVPVVAQACDMVEHLRDAARISSEIKQSFFDHLKSSGAFEGLQALTLRSDPATAVSAAERSRGRDLLDLLEQQRFDPLDEAFQRAKRRGDVEGSRVLERLRTELATVTLEGDRLLHEVTQLDGADMPVAERETRRAMLVARSNELAVRERHVRDERARRLGDVLPVGRTRTVAEIRAALQPGELFLAFTLAEGWAALYVLAPDRDIEAIELPTAQATAARVLPGLLQRSSHEQLRGRDPEGGGAAKADATSSARELFTSLFPAAAWQRVRSCRRVFLAAHRELHRLPFELLVTDVVAGKPVSWLEEGPPISYVPSGSALHWLRQRGEDVGDDLTSVDLLAVGDPRGLDVAPEVPEHGAFIVSVADGGEGARVGLRPGDVLTSYDGQPLADDKALRDLRMNTERAIEDGSRAMAPIPIEVWRAGETLRFQVQAGLLGIGARPGKARAAYEASLSGDVKAERVLRAGDLERLGKLPPLHGAQAETEAIARVFAARELTAKHLLQAEASESAVFELAAKAKYLHFACHGIAEEFAGQSLSMLVLSQPQHVLPTDDGLLKLSDLLHHWRGRLSSCRLVVLSACRTNVGPTFRDEAPQALPLGFLFAGVPSVVSSLWAVDDASTRELMVDFYGRLLAGETDRLAAFTAAKKALRVKYPDPFHWAPFLFVGSPD